MPVDLPHLIEFERQLQKHTIEYGNANSEINTELDEITDLGRESRYGKEFQSRLAEIDLRISKAQTIYAIYELFTGNITTLKKAFEGFEDSARAILASEKEQHRNEFGLINGYWAHERLLSLAQQLGFRGQFENIEIANALAHDLFNENVRIILPE